MGRIVSGRKKEGGFRSFLKSFVPPIFRKKSWGELHAFFDTMIAGGGDKSTIKSQIAEYRSWVNIATSAIYRRVSTVNYKYFRDDTGEEIKSGTPTYKVISKIFRDPNPYMETRFLKQYLQLQLDLTGMAFCWRVDDPVFHLPLEIWPLNTNNLVAIEVSANTNTGVYPTRIAASDFSEKIHPFRNWILGFTFAVGGRHITIGWDNILYFHYPHPKDPRVGSSPIQSQAYAIAVDHYIEVYERDFFKNNARPDFALQYPESISMDDEDAERIRGSWKEKFGGEGKQHELAIMDRGAEIYEFGPKNEDLALVFLANWSQDKVLAAYGVPPGKVGMVKDVNRANAEGIDITFNSECIKPRLDLIDEVFSRGVLQKFDPRYIMKHDNPIPRDRKQDIEEVKQKVGTPIWTPNEARELEGKKPIPGGEVLYVPMNFVPASLSGKPEPAPVKPSKEEGGKPGVEGEEEDDEDKDKVKSKEIKLLTFKQQNSEEWRERKWKISDSSATQWESVWKSRVRVLFTRQQEEVLNNLEKYAPKSISTFRKKKKVKRNFILLYTKNLYNYIGLHKEKAAKRILEEIKKLDRLLLIKEQAFYDVVVDGFIREKSLEEILLEIDNFFIKKQEDMIDHILFDYDDNEVLFSDEAKKIHSNILLESGQAALDELGVDISFNLGSPLAQQYLAEKVRMFSSSVLSTKADQLKRTLGEGLANGESLHKLNSRVRGVYGSVLSGGYEAERIAATETIGSLNAGKFDAYNQGGVVEEKEWLSARTANTRGAAASDQADHWNMDGQRKPLDQPFVDPRSRAKLMFPGDISLGAGGKDVIKCRCSMLGNLEVTKEETDFPDDFNTNRKRFTTPELFDNIKNEEYKGEEDFYNKLFGGRQEARNRIRDAVANSNVYISIKGSTLRNEVLRKNGKFKNSMEAGKGTFKTVGVERARKERELFGIVADYEDVDKWPKYGFLSDAENMSYEDIVGWGYGNVFVKFKKDAVWKRTTATFGNSYDGNIFNINPKTGKLQAMRLAPSTKLTEMDEKMWWGAAMRPPEAEYTKRLVASTKIDDIAHYGTDSYAEAQIYGKTTLDDVEALYVGSKKEKLALERALKKIGRTDIKILPCKYNENLKLLWGEYHSGVGSNLAASLNSIDIDNLGNPWCEKLSKRWMQTMISFAENGAKRGKAFPFPEDMLDTAKEYFARRTTINEQRVWLKDFYSRMAKKEHGGLPEAWWEDWRQSYGGFTDDVLNEQLLQEYPY